MQSIVVKLQSVEVKVLPSRAELKQKAAQWVEKVLAPAINRQVRNPVLHCLRSLGHYLCLACGAVSASHNDIFIALKNAPAADQAGIHPNTCCVEDRRGRETNLVAK